MHDSPLGSSARRARPLLGTFVEIACETSEGRSAHHAVDLAFAQIARIQAVMSFHDRDSELSRLNSEALSREVAVGTDLLAVLCAGLAISRMSAGQFDFTAVSPLIARGWLPAPENTSALTGDWRDIEVTRDNHIRFNAPLAIDLGGIAKGYAVDLAVSALKAGGAICGCVNAGGDMAIFGRTVPVRVRHPAQPGRFVSLGCLADCAVCTSASYFALDDGADAPLAIADPRSCALLSGGFSYTVIARSCMLADALTKVAAFADDLDHGEECVATLAACGAQMLVLDSKGGARCSAPAILSALADVDAATAAGDGI